MSRSRKKHPVITDKAQKWAKKDANKRVRNTDEITNGSNYKKHFNSWDICDYKCWIGFTSKIKQWWKELGK